MKCWKCGADLTPGASFCSSCGAKQEQDAPSRGPAPSAPGGTDRTIVLTVFAAVCMAVCGGLAVRSVFGALGGLLDLRWAGIFGALCSVVLNILSAAMLAVMAIACGLTAFKRNERSSDGLLVCLAAGGVGFLAVRLLSLVVSLFVYTSVSLHFAGLFTSVLGVAAAVAGIYVIERFVLGEFPLMGKTVDDLKLDVWEALHSFQQTAGEVGAQASQAAQNAKAEREARAAAQAQYAQDQYGQYQQPGEAGGPQYGQTPPPPQGYAPFRPKADRSLVAYILLSLITCGIYSWYFIYALARDVNAVCAGDGKSTAGLIKLILLSMITCGFYGLYWYYALGNRLAENAPRYGLSFQENGTTVLLWYLVGMLACGIGPFVGMHIIIKNANALCGAYNYQHGI